MKVDVYCDTGVSVEVPDGTDIDSEAGYLIVKEAAYPKILRCIQEDCFDIEIDDSYFREENQQAQGAAT